MISVCCLQHSVWCILILLRGMTDMADSGYFPPRALTIREGSGGTDDAEDIMVRAYAEALRRMNEPSLWGLSQHDKGLSVYRFLWMPTWGRPVVARIEKAGGRVALTVVQLDGNGGYDPGQVAFIKQVSLSGKQWDRLRRKVEEAGFWRMGGRGDDMGFDGEDLIVEGVRDGAYHVVDRWCPRPGAYRELCRTMLDLTGIDLGQSGWPAPPPQSWGGTILVALVVLFALLFTVFRLRSHSRRKPPLSREWGLDQ